MSSGAGRRFLSASAVLALVALILAPPLGAQLGVAVPRAAALNVCDTSNCGSLHVVINGTGSGTVVATDGSIDCTWSGGPSQSGTCSSGYFWSKSNPTLELTLTITPGRTSRACDPITAYKCNAQQGAPATLQVNLSPGTSAEEDVTFVLVTHVLTISTSGGGSGTVPVSPQPRSTAQAASGATQLTYEDGTAVTLTATPGATSTFAGWSGACSGQGATCLLTMTSDETTDAAFGPATAPPPGSTPHAPTVTPPTVELAAFPESKGKAWAIIRWSGTPGDAPITAYDVQQSVAGGPWTEVGIDAALATAVRWQIPLGASLRFRARAADSAGHTGDWSTSGPVMAAQVGAIATGVKYAGHWTARSVSGSWSGHVEEAGGAGASASLTFHGSSLVLVAPRSSKLGSLRVYLDGTLSRTVSLASSKAAVRQVMFLGKWGVAGKHTVRIVVVGTKGHPAVDLDGFAVLDNVAS